MSTIDESPSPEKTAYRRLYRSPTQKVLGGVCGGLAEYFNIDVAIVRVLWILFTLAGGAGFLAYVLCWIIIPLKGDPATIARPHDSAGLIVGIILLIIGVSALFSWIGWSQCQWWVPFGFHWVMLPGFVIVLGFGLLLGWALFRSPATSTMPSSTEQPSPSESPPPETNAAPPPRPARAYRSRNQRIIAGICGGLGEYFHLDPTIIRILWVFFAIASLGMAVLVYIILIFVLPEELT